MKRFSLRLNYHSNLIYLFLAAVISINGVGCSEKTNEKYVQLRQNQEYEDLPDAVKMIEKFLRLQQHLFEIESVGANSRIRFWYCDILNGRINGIVNSNLVIDVASGEVLPIRFADGYSSIPFGRGKWWYADIGRSGNSLMWTMPENQTNYAMRPGYGKIGLGESKIVYGVAFYAPGIKRNEENFFAGSVCGVALVATVESLDGVDSNHKIDFSDPPPN